MEPSAVKNRGLNALNIASKHHWGFARTVGTALYCMLCDGRIYHNTLSLLLEELADIPDAVAIDVFKGVDEAVKPSLMPNEIVSEDHPVALDRGMVARFLSLKSLIGRGNFVEKRSLAEEVVERQTTSKARYGFSSGVWSQNTYQSRRAARRKTLYVRGTRSGIIKNLPIDVKTFNRLRLWNALAAMEECRWVLDNWESTSCTMCLIQWSCWRNGRCIHLSSLSKKACYQACVQVQTF